MMDSKNYKVEISCDYTFLKEKVVIGDTGKIINLNYINEIRHSLQLPLINNKFQYFKKLMYSLNGNDMFFDDLLSNKNKSDYLNYLKCEIESTKKYIGDYFLNVYPVRLAFFEKIKTLKGCEKTFYDHNTITGRLKVVKGTNFLTMKKEDRFKLEHEDINRKIFEIDFKSCEPNFYLKSQNINYESDDVYSFLSNKFNITGKRDNLKRGILAIMYGAGIDTVSKISKIKISQLKSIKSYMKIEEFKNKLDKELQENGYIRNFYGRPLLSKNNLLNHWVQSSTADYCILSFNQLLNNNSIQAHGIIHDAVIVSTCNNEIKNISSIKEVISNIKIPVDTNSLR